MKSEPPLDPGPIPAEQDPVDLLLVDDRVEDLRAMSLILERPGYHVVTASSGQAALRELLKHEFALILLDVLMPTMDGFELAAMIRSRARTAHTPIIFLTAAGADYPQIYRGYSVGAVDYLVKPVDPDVLSAKVSIFAELFRKDRRIQRQAEALREAERRQRELELEKLRHAAERRYRNLAEAIPTIVWTANSRGGLEYANRRWVEYTGVELEAARGDGWLEALHPDDVARSLRSWRDSVELGHEHYIECRLRRRSDGACRWHQCRAVPERNEEGTIVGWLGTYMDFEELKQAIRARDDFLSIASHELRTPLTALKLRVQTLQRTEQLPPDLKKKVDSAARQTDRLERLIDNLLDVSRVTTGHLQLEPEPIDLAETVRDVADRLRDEAAVSGSELEVNAPDALAGTWDRMRLEQVLTNLISNAIKYGAGQPIRVSLERKGDSARLVVSDSGIGIAETDLERIFGQFERATQRPKSGGLGMGLYIAQQIVVAHGGTISVSSRPGEGAAFNVELPIDQPLTADATMASS